MSGGTPAIANAMPRPPSGGTPKQGAEKPALGNGRPPFLHLGPDTVHDGLVHGLRVSALHSQANPFIRFLSARHDQVGDVRTAGELFKHLWALCNGPTDGLNAALPNLREPFSSGPSSFRMPAHSFTYSGGAGSLEGSFECTPPCLGAPARTAPAKWRAGRPWAAELGAARRPLSETAR